MLWPTPTEDVDPSELYARPRRGAVGDRPWVVLCMIGTVDGAATDDQDRSGGLGGPGDRRVLAAIRGIADVIVAGAATVRAEDYGPARPSEATRAARRARGQAERPRIAVVSASLRLDPGARLFAEAGPGDPRPLVLTGAASDPAARHRLAEVADVVVTGAGRGVDWPDALVALRAATGAGVAAVEGGPAINGQLVASGAVDEVCATVAPVLAGGTASRIASGPAGGLRHLALEHVLEDEGFVMLRYARPTQ